MLQVPFRVSTNVVGTLFKAKSVLSLLIAAMLSGCGTFVPNLTESLDKPDDLAGELMVQAIVASMRCELKNAVTKVINEDIDSARANGITKTYSDFLNEWGAEVSLTLTVLEKTEISPAAILNSPTSPTIGAALFSISGGFSVSSQATRIEKMNFFYRVRELYLRDGDVCDARQENPMGSFLVGTDLKIDSVLRSRINTVALRQANAPDNSKQNVLSHQVTFQAIATGNVTPTWRLVRATVNPSGPLFDARRDRTHDLLITFGPLDKAQGGRSLISIAEQSHTISQINSGFRTSNLRQY